LGKLRLPDHFEQFIADQLFQNGITPLPVMMSHALRVKELPLHHRDPFDRMLVWQAWLGTTTLFWPPSPLLGVTSVLITIPFVFSSCYFCFQAQAGWLQHDFGHLSVFKKSKWDHFFHYLTIGAIKVTTVVVPAPVFLWLPSACGFFSSCFFFCFFFPALFFFPPPCPNKYTLVWQNF